MRSWVLSDWHTVQRVVFDPPRLVFDVRAVAGDVSSALEEVIHMVGLLAAGKPAIFVAGNHEWWRDRRSREEKLVAAHASAPKARRPLSRMRGRRHRFGGAKLGYVLADAGYFHDELFERYRTAAPFKCYRRTI